jgi:methionine synthase II (cobalamin-independent)
MAATKSGHAKPFTQEEIDKCFTAMIAHAGSPTGAIRYLQHEEPEARVPSPGTLMNWARGLHWERYEHLRETWAAKVEQTIANDMRDAAREAIEVQRLAVQRARERLEGGRDDDPAKSAASLARVAQSNTDKLMTLTNRPTQIVENRSVDELLRSLVASGALHLADEPEQLEAPADG